MAGFVICTLKEELYSPFQSKIKTRSFPSFIGGSSHLELVEAEREMKDLGKLFSERLLSLQVLHGSVRRAGECLQQAAQGVLCRDASDMLMLQLESVCCCCRQAQPKSFSLGPAAPLFLVTFAGLT